MKEFAALVNILGTSTKTNDKLAALKDYFAAAPGKDKTWVIAIFSGRRPKRIVNSTLLQNWCMEIIGLSQWLFDECYHTVGDLGETIALLLPEPPKEAAAIEDRTLSWYLETFIRIEKEDESIRKKIHSG